MALSAGLAMTLPLCHCDERDSSLTFSEQAPQSRCAPLSLRGTFSSCHCEAGEEPAEAISVGYSEIATHLSGARNDKESLEFGLCNLDLFEIWVLDFGVLCA
jgi:hypothetical protein